MHPISRLSRLTFGAALLVGTGCAEKVVLREVVYRDPPRPPPAVRPVTPVRPSPVADNRTRPNTNPARDRVAPVRRPRPTPAPVKVVDRKPVTKPDVAPLPAPPMPVDDDTPEDTTRPLPLPSALDGVLAEARGHLGKNAVRVNGASFRYDCSGFVRGMFSRAGVDIMALGYEYPDLNGVGLIYNYMDRFGANHHRRIPRPGEVVYFDDTWDKNGNGKLDDPLTHIGIVDAVDSDGTFYVVHKAGRGIVRDPMNVMHPDDRNDASGKQINQFLRPKTTKDGEGTPHLMGAMWAGFGTLGDHAPTVNVSSNNNLFGSTPTGGASLFTDFSNGFEPEPTYDGVIEQ